MAIDKVFRALLIAAAIWLAGCQDVRGLARPIRTDCGHSQPERFFDDVFRGLPDSAIEIPIGSANMLEAMREPSLSCGADFDQAYRILFSAPSGMTMAIRVASTDGEATLFSVAFDRKLQKTLSRSERKLTDRDFREFLSAVDNFDFWVRSPSPTPTSTDTGLIVLHSGVWIFEGTADNWYHAIARGALPREREFNAIGKWLFTAADYEVPGEFLVRSY